VPVAAALDRVLRSTTPARPLALARIVLAAVALAKAADLAPVLFRLADGGVLRLPYGPWSPDPSPALARALAVVWAGAGLAFLIGWRTRLAGALLVAAMTLALAVDQHLYSNHFYLAILLCLLLTVADSGAALSADARRDGERAMVAGWPVVLLKLQLSIVYGFAVLAKLNTYYLSGSVLLVHWTRQGPYALPDPLRGFEVLVALSLLALLAEALLAVGLWFRRTRHPTFVVGLALHLAIIPTMGSTWHLLLFAAMMFALYLLFLDAAPRSRLVVWDDHCTFCRDWVRSFRRLDWLRVHRFEGSSDPAVLAGAAIAREEADAALQLVTTTGTRLSGFDAVRSILEHLPASFLWAPVLRLPPVRRVGDRAYRRVAARRACEVPFSVEV
jgi:predicted DCC family thiol-disulfide oxidoreductase YuxK